MTAGAPCGSGRLRTARPGNAPAKLPMVRIYQILTRGVEPQSSWLLPSTGSDRRPVAARVRW
ncbi:hypothetical protein OHT57_03175 [Streptomyces sp. NBC_00285]|uniref:hypothetical protein n=1 Tax=Streptomyces sp. NBC_00285 TaxID=2975700 RepID=UPI002E2A0A38|nr:hypothetical protein [Streptomyces sp. NBC_00285]